MQPCSSFLVPERLVEMVKVSGAGGIACCDAPFTRWASTSELSLSSGASCGRGWVAATLVPWLLLLTSAAKVVRGGGRQDQDSLLVASQQRHVLSEEAEVWGLPPPAAGELGGTQTAVRLSAITKAGHTLSRYPLSWLIWGLKEDILCSGRLQVLRESISAGSQGASNGNGGGQARAAVPPLRRRVFNYRAPSDALLAALGRWLDAAVPRMPNRSKGLLAGYEAGEALPFSRLDAVHSTESQS